MLGSFWSLYGNKLLNGICQYNFISSNNSVAKFTDAILLGPLDQHRRQKVGTKCYRNFQLNVRGSTEMWSSLARGIDSYMEGFDRRS